jgi:hypothetical protein
MIVNIAHQRKPGKFGGESCCKLENVAYHDIPNATVMCLGLGAVQIDESH